MHIVEMEHPLARDILCRLRDERTGPGAFRSLSRAMGHLLAVECTRRLGTSPIQVKTPLEETFGELCTSPPVLLPVLRAGMGLLPAFQDLLPGSPVGFVAVRRDEATAKPLWFYDSVPQLEGRHVIVLDPMLATGGTSGAVVEYVFGRGAAEVTLACVVAAPEGVAELCRFDGLLIIAAAVDRELDDRWYILPGLGDYGDRLFGEGSPEPGP